jgi:hypothetical protein
MKRDNRIVSQRELDATGAFSKKPVSEPGAEIVLILPAPTASSAVMVPPCGFARRSALNPHLWSPDDHGRNLRQPARSVTRTGGILF